MFVRLGFIFFAALAFARAADDSERAPFTAKELAQGYREHVVLARPRAASRATTDAAEARDGVRVREKFPRLRDLRVIDLDDTDHAERAIARLRATGRYEFVEPDYLRHIAVAPNDPKFADGSLWAMRNTGQSLGIPGADIKAAAAWDIIHDAPNVVVAVVDTGVNLNHRDLSANLWTNPAPTFGDLHGANFVNGITSGDPTDDNGHGTHVAGTIGAMGDNGLAVAGVAWRVQIMAVKVFPASGSGSVSDIARGINYAVLHGANIINASYGESGSTGFSKTEFDAISAAREAGIVFVAAAGNDGANMDLSRYYPASHALDNIVTVGNSTRRDELAVSSNYGSPVDLFAPGSDIVSLSYSSVTGTATLSGTSMAAPHVSGALALLKAQFPNEDYRQLINRLYRSVDPGDRFAGKAQTGGRLNLYRALTLNDSRPFNDDFATRARVVGDNLAIRSSSAGATTEPGEPVLGDAPAASTLWWEWTAPAAGIVGLDTSGSSYDTVLAVYTGSVLSALTPVATNDNGGDDLTSRLTFSAQAGVTYQFAVGGRGGAFGLTLLNLGTTPSNDAFASPATLSGISTHLTATNAHCSREPGELTILGFAGGKSLWYRWIAPANGRFQIAAVSSDFDPLLAVYAGTSLNTLSLVSASDNTGNGSAQTGSLCTIEATAGFTYLITVDSKSAATVGQFTLSLTDSQWQAVTADTVTGAPAVASDGTIYVGGTDRAFYAVNPNGTQKWSYVAGGLIDTCSAAIGDDGTIYVGTSGGKFFALRPEGTSRWSHDFGTTAAVSNSPAIAADGTVYVKADDGYLYALDPATGATKWRYNVHALASYASPCVAPDGTIYQGSDDKNLYALNPDGTLKWTFATDNDIYTAPAIDSAGNLYFGVLNSGRFWSITSAGALRWTYSGSTLGISSSAALSADGSTVYFGAYDHLLHAVDTATGVARWTFTLGNEVRASSPAVDANGVIYIGCYDYKLYAVNSDGTLKRTYDTGNIVRSSPAISGTTLYLGSNDHKLYAFDIGAALASGPWPQYRQNTRRLGRAIATATAPVITTQPLSQSAAPGASLALSVAASGSPTYRWQFNGTDLSGATSSTLALPNFQPANAGLYFAVATGSVSATSAPAVVGIVTTDKIVGPGEEVLSNQFVVSANNTFDQILLQGAAITVTANPAQVTRLSFVDLTNDIVQVEFSGAGSLSLVLDNPSGPAAPSNYNQPGVAYMKGHAGIVIAGADESTNVSVFSVGRITAVNQALFNQPIAAYDGVADLAFLAILSPTGRFGGVRTANASYFATKGYTGIYAPGINFAGPVYVGDISAASAATPVLLLASAADTQINGGDLLQANNQPVKVSGVAQLKFVAGTTSHGTAIPAQTNRAHLEQNGADITSQVVVNPSP